MPYFYKEGRLKVGTVESHADVADLASRQDGPVYIYDLDHIRRRFEALNRSFEGSRHTLHYAMKANSHPAILRLLASLGAGVDTVSAGEIRQAIAHGFTPDRVIFSGVAKTVAELETAIGSGIKQINVESPQELERIAAIAARLNRTADVAFRLNPDVNPQTHPYITTGFRENKFGMDKDGLDELIVLLKRAGSSVKLRGLTMHIGSQLFDLEVMKEAIGKIRAVHHDLERRGFQLDRLDIGGGLGIRYETDDESSELAMMESYGRMARESLQGLSVEILTEPGRILVARAGLLVGEVQYVKRTPGKTFAILNTGMHHLIRPALYGARHRILAVTLPPSSSSPRSSQSPSSRTSHPAAHPASHQTFQRYDIVGPICESSDFLGKDIELPEVRQGDLLAIADAGAYGFTMASRYNSHELPTEIAVTDGLII